MKILTLNTRLLPDDLDDCNYHRMIKGLPRLPKKQIASEIAKKLNAYAFDVVCLQEVFHEKARKVLYSTLREFGHYSTFVKKVAAKDILTIQDSGLFVASRLPFVALKMGAKEYLKYHRFKAKSAEDGAADKGIIGFMVKDGAQILWIFNTHMQAGVGLERRRTRIKQLKELRKFVRCCIDNETPDYIPGKPGVVLLGDLNISGPVAGTSKGSTSKEYKALRRAFSMPSDLGLQCSTKNNTYTWNPKSNNLVRHCYGAKSKPARLDYILALNNSPGSSNKLGSALANVQCNGAGLVKFRGKNKRDLTDHYGVGAEIKVNNGHAEFA